MRRLIFCFMIISLFFSVLYGLGVTTEDINFDTVQPTEILIKTLRSKIDAINTDITQVANIGAQAKGTGNYYYVDSGVGSDSYDGTKWEYATATVDAAINLCDADNGDVIFIAQNHAESYSAANGFDADVNGITIVCLGNGNNMATFTFADTDATVAIGADNVTIIGGRFLAGISEVVMGISVEAAGDYFTLIGAEFPEPLTSTFEFDKAIVLATGADHVSILNCKAYSCDATGATAWLDMSTGINNDTTIAYNIVQGEYATAAIYSNKVDLENYLIRDVVTNMTTGIPAVLFSAAATGFAYENKFYGDTWGTLGATIFDPGSLKCAGNLGSTSTDKNASPIPSASLGQTIFDQLIGADGISTWPTGAKPANGVSLSEGLRYLVELLANGTPATITAPGTNQTILDILGTNGTTTTGAVAGSILGAIGTNEAAAATPFSSSTVESDADGSILERLEYMQASWASSTVADVNTNIIALVTDANTNIMALVNDVNTVLDTNIDLIIADTAAIEPIVTDLGGISQVGDKVVADMDANSVLYWQPRAISATADEITDAILFTVTGGPIRIISIVGYVDVLIGANATTCKLWIDTTAGAAYDQDFSTAVNIETDAVGTMYVFSAANPGVLTPLTPGSSGAGNPQYPWHCPPGNIAQLMSADPGGAGGNHITWYMTYQLLKAGVTVTAP